MNPIQEKFIQGCDDIMYQALDQVRSDQPGYILGLTGIPFVRLCKFLKAENRLTKKAAVKVLKLLDRLEAYQKKVSQITEYGELQTPDDLFQVLQERQSLISGFSDLEITPGHFHDMADDYEIRHPKQIEFHFLPIN